MTVIKIKNDISEPDCCRMCPFIEYVEETDYDVPIGWSTAYCSLNSNLIIGDTRDLDNGLYEKHKDCPIISFESGVQ